MSADAPRPSQADHRRGRVTSTPPADVNGVIGGLLRDLAAVQADRQKTFAYRRAAAAVLSLDEPLDVLTSSGRPVPKIPGLGPSSMRVVNEVLATGESPTVNAAVDASGKRDDIRKLRHLQIGFFSRAVVRQILANGLLEGPTRADYRGDLQMHSTWSDGVMSLSDIAVACQARSYAFAAVTDHSRGLAIAKGMKDDEVVRQHRDIDAVNEQHAGRLRLLRGIETNIDAAGALDLTPQELAAFEIVLAAPHSQLRLTSDQTDRMLKAIDVPGVHILAHPRGRMSRSRAGIVADWSRIFKRAAQTGVAIEIDGDPSRQDLDYELARQAYEAGCVIALDSDAHSTAELDYADTALAHARLAGIPPQAIVNCWPLDRLLDWSRDRQGGTRAPRRSRRDPVKPAARASG